VCFCRNVAGALSIVVATSLTHTQAADKKARVSQQLSTNMAEASASASATDPTKGPVDKTKWIATDAEFSAFIAACDDDQGWTVSYRADPLTVLWKVRFFLASVALLCAPLRVFWGVCVYKSK